MKAANGHSHPYWQQARAASRVRRFSKFAGHPGSKQAMPALQALSPKATLLAHETTCEQTCTHGTWNHMRTDIHLWHIHSWHMEPHVNRCPFLDMVARACRLLATFSLAAHADARRCAPRAKQQGCRRAYCTHPWLREGTLQSSSLIRDRISWYSASCRVVCRGHLVCGP